MRALPQEGAEAGPEKRVVFVRGEHNREQQHAGEVDAPEVPGG